MAEHPIIFSGPMVRAILNGTKTQTRRIMRDFGWWNACGLERDDSGWPMGETAFGDWERIACPYGEVGDTLWVRESMMKSMRWDEKPRTAYCADEAWAWDLHNPCEWIWKRPTLPSIHMPRGLSRISLRVTDVRVQRVQDISEEDARAEGAMPIDPGTQICEFSTRVTASPYREGFFRLWDKINAKRGHGWDTNPYVWAITFKRLENRNA